MSSESEPEKVTVKLKRGSWEIEISAPGERIQQAVESVLAGMTSKEPATIEQALERTEGRSKVSCREVLLRIWREGWFVEPRILSEVDAEMNRRGYHYDRTAVAHILGDLVREGTLFRDGSVRNYRYVQKRPLSEESSNSVA